MSTKKILIFMVAGLVCLGYFYFMNEPIKRIIVIRNDDVVNDTPALRWFTDLIISKDIKCTYAVIPHQLTPSGIQYLKGLDSSRFEFATHGYDHTLNEDSAETQLAARDLMISIFGKVPTSIAAPYYNVTPEYIDMATKLGYRSQINYDDSNSSLYTFPISFYWETNWENLTYGSYDNFIMAFTEPDAPKVFVINTHHELLYLDERAKICFSNSINTMKNMEACVFMTEEEATNYLNRGDYIQP